MLDKFVTSMASLRVMSGTIEILAAVLMLKLGRVDKALAVNSALAFVGPSILIITTAIGLSGMADRLSWSKILWIGIGVGCLLIGILKK